ncbi:MAG: RNA polymerase sigma factor, partial [Candidatus Eisenbacteria bacterium]|nr:RNA polymerase sigma factor [Candidatus Eisenbacteria bacterium]
MRFGNLGTAGTGGQADSAQPGGRWIVHVSRNGDRPLAIDEASLIARLRARDLDALGELYRELGGAMLTLARSLLRDRDQADDVVADALVRVQEAAPGFRGERGLRTWVLRIVANRAKDALRRRRFEGGRIEDANPLEAAGLIVNPLPEWDEALDRNVRLAALERALESLPIEQRQAVVLKERIGLSVLETAKVLGISESAVKSRLFRARAALLERFREWDPGDL